MQSQASDPTCWLQRRFFLLLEVLWLVLLKEHMVNAPRVQQDLDDSDLAESRAVSRKLELLVAEARVNHKPKVHGADFMTQNPSLPSKRRTTSSAHRYFVWLWLRRDPRPSKQGNKGTSTGL